MTLRKWIDSLEDNADYKYFMHMGDNYYTEMPLGKIFATERYAKHPNLKAKRFILHLKSLGRIKEDSDNQFTG